MAAIKSLAALHASILLAVQTGENERNSIAERKVQDARQLAERLIAEAPERARTTIESIPNLVFDVVAYSSSTPDSVCIMWVEQHEYDGAIEVHNGLGYRPWGAGEPEKLKLAAKEVFEALAELQPELKYGHKAVAGENGQTSGLKYLGIFIRING